MIVTELVPCDNRKSFYNKALVLEDEKTGDIFLQSYDTIVCGIIKRQFVKFWDGYSATTMRHINSFIIAYSHKADNITCQSGGKGFWNSLVTEKAPTNPIYAKYNVNPIY